MDPKVISSVEPILLVNHINTNSAKQLSEQTHQTVNVLIFSPGWRILDLGICSWGIGLFRIRLEEEKTSIQKLMEHQHLQNSSLLFDSNHLEIIDRSIFFYGESRFDVNKRQILHAEDNHKETTGKP